MMINSRELDEFFVFKLDFNNILIFSLNILFIKILNQLKKVEGFLIVSIKNFYNIFKIIIKMNLDEI